jgi:DNA-binding PadR family transcriptional regulator
MTIYHNHHIIPIHAGGTDHPDNLVRLTTEGHAEAHRLLYEKYGRWQDKKAWEGLAGFKDKEQIIKEIQSRPKSEEQKKKIAKTLTGKKLSEETKKKMRNSSFNGRGLMTEETRKKMGAAQKGIPMLEETKKKLSQAAKKRYANGFVNAMSGKTHTEEWKKKMSKTIKKIQQGKDYYFNQYGAWGKKDKS